MKLMTTCLMASLGLLAAAPGLPITYAGDGANTLPSPCLTLEPSPSARPTPEPFAPPRTLLLDYAAASTLKLDEAGSAGESGAPETDADLVKKTQNPVASLISVPFQYNADFNIGPKNATRSILNIQPVIPFTLNKDWNLITRTIVPLICMDSPADGQPSRYGVGDVSQSFFFSPKEPTNGWTWGAGPVLLWPSATDDSLGTGKFGAGPTAVILKQESGWTYGMLANHIWSYAGDSDRQEVNATFVQPFLSYTFPTFTTLGINTETTYDWRHEQFTVPINATVTQLLKVGGMPMSFQLGGRYYAEGPSGGPEWGIRFTVTLLFPK